MKVTVAGATGFIGQPLVRAIAADPENEVIVLTRDARDAEEKFPGVDALFIDWNPAASRPPADALEGTDAVVNLAGDNIATGRWTASKKDRIRSSRVMTTRRLVDGIASCEERPKVLVNGSAIGYYGPRGDEELTEEGSVGTDFLAEVCMDWERSALQLEESGGRVVLLRTGIVLGRGGGALGKMLPLFKLGLGGPLGSGKQWMSWIHVDDEVGLIRHALANESISGPLNATAPNPVRNRDFAATLGKVLGRPAFLPTPGFALKLGLGEFADILLTGQRVLPKKALDTGYSFRYSDLEEALKNSV